MVNCSSNNNQIFNKPPEDKEFTKIITLENYFTTENCIELFDELLNHYFDY